MQQRRIIVSGGGIGGLTFALAAKKMGFDVTVFERSDNVMRANVGGGLGLWPPSQQVMREINALHLLEANGRYMPPPAYYNNQGQVLAKPSEHFPTRFPILCVERDVLLKTLMQCCERDHVEVVAGHEVVSAVPDARTLKVDVGISGDYESHYADVVVGADGIHSKIRNTLLSAASRVEPLHCGYAYFRSTTPIVPRCKEEFKWHSLAFEAWGNGLRFGYVPMKEPDVFWFLAVPIGHDGLEKKRGAHRLETDDEKAWLLKQIENWRGPTSSNSEEEIVSLKKLVELTNTDEILRTDIHKVPNVTGTRWSNQWGNVVLLGDACHATAPNLAQGAGLSIEDAYELALNLADANAAAATSSRDELGDDDGRSPTWGSLLVQATQSYEYTRKPRAWTVQALADTVAIVGQLRGISATLRDIAMQTCSRIAPTTTSRIFEEVVSESLGGTNQGVTWRLPHSKSSPQNPPCMLEAVMGKEAFEDHVPPAAKMFRREPNGLGGRGTVRVERGVSLLSNAISVLAGLPQSTSASPFVATATPHTFNTILSYYPFDRIYKRFFKRSDNTSEFAKKQSPAASAQKWRRRFGSTMYWTTLATTRDLTVDPAYASPTGLVLTEGIGGVLDSVIRFGYVPTGLKGPSLADASERGEWALEAADTTNTASEEASVPQLEFRCVGLWLGPVRLPLPTLLTPHSTWREEAFTRTEDGAQGWRYEGCIRLPPVLGGDVLMRYSGDFVPDPPTRCTTTICPSALTPPKGCAVVLGGTGLLGQRVCDEFIHRGWRVIVPTRAVPKSQTHPLYGEIAWNPDNKDESVKLLSQLFQDGIGAHEEVVVVNLAGENPGTDRWGPTTLRRIQSTRLKVINIVKDALLAAPEVKDKVSLLQASAIGIYGNRGDELLEADTATLPTTPCDETKKQFENACECGRNFRAECCKAIETAASAAGAKTTCNMRIGIVLDANGGLLPHLVLAAKGGVSSIGHSGQQYVSWIHSGDAARMVCNLAQDAANTKDTGSSTIVNVTSPAPCTQKELLHAVAKTQGGFLWSPPGGIPPMFPVPASLFAGVVGPAASVLLDSQRAVPPKESASAFKYEELLDAMSSWECSVPEKPVRLVSRETEEAIKTEVSRAGLVALGLWAMWRL